MLLQLISQIFITLLRVLIFIIVSIWHLARLFFIVLFTDLLFISFSTQNFTNITLAQSFAIPNELLTVNTSHLTMMQSIFVFI